MVDQSQQARADAIGRRRAHDATRAIMRATGAARLRLYVPADEPTGDIAAVSNGTGEVRLGYVRDDGGVFSAVVEVLILPPGARGATLRFRIEDGGCPSAAEAERAVELRLGTPLRRAPLRAA